MLRVFLVCLVFSPLALAEKPVSARFTSTLATEKENIRQLAFDGSDDSAYLTTKAPTKTDRVTLTFEKPVTVKSISVLTGKPKGDGGQTNTAVLEASTDGKTFTVLSKFASGKASAEPGKEFTAIRLAFPDDDKEPLSLREIKIESDPPVSVFKYPIEIVPDTSEVPEMKEWLDDVVQVCEKQYPMICDELKSDGYTPPKRITMTLKKDEKGVAYASGSRIVGAASYFSKNKKDVGALVHETAHCVQAYRGRGNPGWLVEGVADYVRFFKYEAKKPAKLNPEQAKYNGSYRTTAAFLDYLCETHDKDIVRKLNEAMRKGRYDDEIWTTLTKKTVEELGRDWQKSLAK